MNFFGIALSLMLSCINAQGDSPVPPRKDPTASEPSNDGWTFWPQSYLEVGLDISPELQSALANAEYAVAIAALEGIDIAQLSSEEATKIKVLLAWCYLHSANRSQAIPYLSAILAYTDLPDDYRNLMIGEIRQEQEEYSAALESLRTIPSTSPLYVRAQFQAANISKDSGSTKQYREILTTLSEQADPFTNGAKVLYALAMSVGLDSPKSHPLLRRIWMYYPYSEQAKITASNLEGLEQTNAMYKATAGEWANRADSVMEAWQFQQVINELKPQVPTWTTYTPETCRALYAYGRSHFKLNSVTKAAKILEPVGDNCSTLDAASGAKALYLTGKSLERKKMWAAAAKAYEKIPQLYPTHSMADDGYALAGIGWQESGDVERAMQSWERQVKEYPKGDLVGEGYWRLAWNAFRNGNTEQAISWATMAKETVPASGHQYQYFAFYYWDARWRIWPNWDEPSKQNPEEEQVRQGIALFKELVTNHPTRFYSLLAAQRLYELEPDFFNDVKKAQSVPQQQGWWLPDSLVQEERVSKAAYLSHLGLYSSAWTEIQQSEATNSPTFMALKTFIHGQSNWIEAHDVLHKYIQKHPPSTWQRNNTQILRQTYPNQYWDLVQEVSVNHKYDPRIFHALVREESSFNPQIKSWAGAKGLSQLMPATAKRVASWLGTSVNGNTIYDPQTNLRIGSRYLEYLRSYFSGNMFLAVAAYNAGEGNVGKWLNSKGNLPTDAFIESIPFRETRHYVKRVMGTYQVYHWVYDEGESFYDFSDFNHQAKP